MSDRFLADVQRRDHLDENLLKVLFLVFFPEFRKRAFRQ